MKQRQSSSPQRCVSSAPHQMAAMSGNIIVRHDIHKRGGRADSKSAVARHHGRDIIGENRPAALCSPRGHSQANDKAKSLDADYRGSALLKAGSVCCPLIASLRRKASAAMKRRNGASSISRSLVS